MNFFATLFRTCIGFRGYPQLADVPYRYALKYLAGLVALLTALVVLAVVPWILPRLTAVADFIDREIPRFEINNHVAVPVKSDAPEKASSGLFVLDLGESEAATPDTAVREENAPPQTTRIVPFLVIRRDAFVVRKDVFESAGRWFFYGEPFEWANHTAAKAQTADTVSIPFSKLNLPDGVFTGQYFSAFAKKNLLMTVPVTWLLLAGCALLVCIVQANIFASFGAALGRNQPYQLSFSQLRNLSTFAITPGAILVAVYVALQLQGMNLPLIYLVAYGIFLIGSTNACRPRREEEAQADDSEFF